MYARVVTWTGGDAEAMRSSAADIESQSESGPPEGVPANGFTFLIDGDGSRAMAIMLFETEADRQQGHDTLEQMSPPGDGLGNRSAVDFYDVALDFRL